MLYTFRAAKANNTKSKSDCTTYPFNRAFVILNQFIEKKKHFGNQLPFFTHVFFLRKHIYSFRPRYDEIQSKATHVVCAIQGVCFY